MSKLSFKKFRLLVNGEYVHDELLQLLGENVQLRLV